jgi:hypothetical protein
MCILKCSLNRNFWCSGPKLRIAGFQNRPPSYFIGSNHLHIMRDQYVLGIRVVPEEKESISLQRIA